MIRTIGHSTLSEAEFVARCRHAGIESVIDIRSHPTSKWPHFNRESMIGPDSWLAKAGLRYLWVPDLAGWSEEDASDPVAVDWANRTGVDLSAYTRGFFPKDHISKKLVHSAGPMWNSRGMLDFAYYTALPKFQIAARLIGTERDDSNWMPKPGLMCTEFVWWKCHRAMVADYLTWIGVPVQHVLPSPTMHQNVLGNRFDRYPEQVRATWGARAVRGAA